MAQVGGWEDELPDYGEPTPFIYADGVNEVGEIVDGFGRAVIDASNNRVTIQSGVRSFQVSFNEIANHASAGNAVRKAHINAEIGHVFRGGGIGLADGGMGFSNPRDSIGLTDYRDFLRSIAMPKQILGLDKQLDV